MGDLARRAVRCAAWRWMPGMRAVVGGGGMGRTFVRYAEEGSLIQAGYSREPLGTDERLPALTDPATLGCLLALVREAWGCQELSVAYNTWSDATAGWVVCWDLGGPWQSMADMPHLPTEAEALVAALEAAPTKTG